MKTLTILARMLTFIWWLDYENIENRSETSARRINLCAAYKTIIICTFLAYF